MLSFLILAQFFVLTLPASTIKCANGVLCDFPNYSIICDLIPSGYKNEYFKKLVLRKECVKLAEIKKKFTSLWSFECKKEDAQPDKSKYNKSVEGPGFLKENWTWGQIVGLSIIGALIAFQCIVSAIWVGWGCRFFLSKSHELGLWATSLFWKLPTEKRRVKSLLFQKCK